MPTELLTEWLNIGTSGPTVDGRIIKPEWLEEAADSYDPGEYTAVANAEHWFGNYGSARKLRTIKDDKGRTKLQARIRPNKYYLEQNSEGKRLFFSMELTHDFAKTGKTYLTGLATTDKPASLGTSEAHFSRQDDENVFRGGSEEVDFSKFSVSESDSKNIVAAVVDGIKDLLFKNNNTNEQKEDYEMTDEQFNQMLDGQNKVTTALESLTGVVTNLTTKPDKDGKDGKDGDGKGDDGKEKETDKTNATAGNVSEEQFNQMVDGQNKLNDSIVALTGKLETALNGKFGKDTSGGTGAENDCEFV